LGETWQEGVFEDQSEQSSAGADTEIQATPARTTASAIARATAIVESPVTIDTSQANSRSSVRAAFHIGFVTIAINM
jgi:hypothetical protein